MTTPASSPVVIRLDLGASTSQVWVEDGDRSHALTLPVGTATVAALLRRDPPRGSELEAAIDVVEEAVMPLARLIPRPAVLVAGNAMAQALVGLSTGSGERGTATREAVEAQFGRLALAALRGAWAGQDHPASPLWAGLLILREFMHHAGFDRIESPRLW